MKIIVITPDRKMDALAPLIMNGLYDNDIEVIASDGGNGVRDVYTDEQIIEHAKDADYVFAIFGKVNPSDAGFFRAPRYYLLDAINRPDITAYIDGSEWTCTAHPDSPTQISESVTNLSRLRGEPWISEHMYARCSWYFKRAVFPEDLKRDKIIPCYLGAWNAWCLDSEEDTAAHKEYDLYCSFGGNAGHTGTGLRAPVYDYCKELKDIKSIVGTRLDHKDYLDAVAKSYIGISAWGAANCCMRMWEIIANKTCCFIQEPIIEYPHKFVDGESCVYYSNIDEFKEKLDYYLSNKDECLRIGLNGYNHMKKYHTGKARVQYMLEVMKGKDWRTL